MQTVLDTKELEFTGHTTQAEDAVAPTVTEYVPVPQSVHATLPALALYFPATQPEHTPPSGPVNPALQVQAVTVTLPDGELELSGHTEHVPEVLAPITSEYVPVPQSVHATLPLLVLYFPATHPVHTPPFGPDDPALQVHTVLDAAELELAGHAIQVDETVAPTVTEYVPLEQSKQAVDPLTSLYLPATHAVHVPPFAPVYPALHEHAVMTELELGAFAFRGQAKHTPDVLAPSVAE